MNQYILKLKTTSTVNYAIYDGTTALTDAEITTLFTTAGSAYFSFDFDSLTPTDTTSLNIVDSNDTAVIANTGLTGIAEGKNFKGTWSVSATDFDSFTVLEGKTLDESELSFLMHEIKNAGGGPTVAQTTGTSTTDVMSQAATTNMIYPSGYEATKTRMVIGDGGTASANNALVIGKASASGVRSISIAPAGKSSPNSAEGVGSINIGGNYARGTGSIVLGESASTVGFPSYALCLGHTAKTSHSYSVTLGSNATTTRASEVSIGDGTSNADYGTRYIANVRDPQLAQDAATKNYVDSFYPVGTVYSSTSSTAPTFAGGTWTSIGSQTIGSSTVYYYERTA